MASQSKSWKQCRPANGAEFDGDLDAVDGSKTAERRPIMEAYLQYILPEKAPSLGKMRKAVERLGFKTYLKNGRESVSSEGSEFFVDKTIWVKYFKPQPEDQRPRFPWADTVAADISERPICAKYEQYLAATRAGSAQPAPAPVAEPRPGPSESPKPQQQQRNQAPEFPEAPWSERKPWGPPDPKLEKFGQERLAKKAEKAQRLQASGLRKQEVRGQKSQQRSDTAAAASSKSSLPPKSGLTASHWAPLGTTSTTPTNLTKAASLAQIPRVAPEATTGTRVEQPQLPFFKFRPRRRRRLM